MMQEGREANQKCAFLFHSLSSWLVHFSSLYTFLMCIQYGQSAHDELMSQCEVS